MFNSTKRIAELEADVKSLQRHMRLTHERLYELVRLLGYRVVDNPTYEQQYMLVKKPKGK